MTLIDLHRLCATRGLGFSIDPKLRPNDSMYVTVYSAGNHSHARKAFSTEAEMLAALEQCVGEVLPQRPPGPCTLGVGCNEAGVCYADKHGEGMMCGAVPVDDNLDDFSDDLGSEFG